VILTTDYVQTCQETQKKKGQFVLHLIGLLRHIPP